MTYELPIEPMQCPWTPEGIELLQSRRPRSFEDETYSHQEQRQMTIEQENDDYERGRL